MGEHVELDTEEFLSLERLVFFSDAVMAIAITLLIIEIHVPKLGMRATSAEYWAELNHLMPNFFAYALSFIVIGLFWGGHHRIFAHAQHYHGKLLWPNLLFLMAIAFMPFSTALLGSNGPMFVPSLVYNGTLFLCALMLLWTAFRVRRYAGAVGQDNLIRSGVTTLAALLCIALCWVTPLFSQFGMLLALTGPLLVRFMGRNRRA